MSRRPVFDEALQLRLRLRLRLRRRDGHKVVVHGTDGKAVYDCRSVPAVISTAIRPHSASNPPPAYLPIPTD